MNALDIYTKRTVRRRGIEDFVCATLKCTQKAWNYKPKVFFHGQWPILNGKPQKQPTVTKYVG